MPGNQRFVAPWADHHWWGQYDNPGQLPNVAGATLQMNNEVQAGDMAWSLFDQQLYVCIGGTFGAAVWQPVVMGLPDATPIDLYVAADAATADDAGPGTIAEPLATLDQAIYRINNRRIITAPIIVHVAPAAAAYTWGATLGPVLNSQPIVIIGDGAGQGGDGFIELQPSTAAEIGSSLYQIVDLVGGLVDHVFEGKTIEMLSGAAAGDRRTIADNDTENIWPTLQFSAAPVAGDLYRIVEPSVTVLYDGADEYGEDHHSILGVGTPAVVDNVYNAGATGDNPSSLLLINFRLRLTQGALAVFKVARSAVFLAGVEMDKSGPAALAVSLDSQFFAGTDRYKFANGTQFWQPFHLGLAPAKTAWAGWGAYFNALNVTAMLSFRGFLTLASQSVPGVQLHGIRWWVMGGAIRSRVSVTGTGFLRITGDITFNAPAGSLPIRLHTETAEDGVSTVRVGGGGRVYFENCRVTIGGAGTAIVSAQEEETGGPKPSVHVYTGNSVGGVRAHLGADFGGVVFYKTPVTALSVPTINDLIVTQGNPGGAAVANGTFASLAAGAVLYNPGQPDGSILSRIT